MLTDDIKEVSKRKERLVCLKKFTGGATCAGEGGPSGKKLCM